MRVSANEKECVILCNWWCLYLSWLFLGALRGAGEGAGVVSGALANLDLVVNVVALNGEGHGGTLGHTLKHNSIFTRPFDSQISTQSRFGLFGKKLTWLAWMWHPTGFLMVTSASLSLGTFWLT